MSSTTTKLGLIKPADSEYPDIKDAVNDNMDILDSEVWMRGKSFNGETVGTDGGFHVNYIPYSGNFETSAGQKSEEDYIIRTTGGEASLEDGDAWLLMLRGRMRHDNFTPQSITMTVIPMERTPDPAITASLNEETFEAYVGQAGTYTLTYTTEWSANPSDYGLTISNTPIAGDTIVIVWDGENDAEVTVNAETRPTPEAITATIDEDVFVTYVTQTGTTTLTYSTAWSADPANYGITVTGTPIAGDVITVVYVKEIRGTIVQSNPQTFVSTGWNLYNHALGYARVIKYSSESGYGFKISGTYTALEFSTTTTGTRTTITPVSGYFTIPSDGYVFVTGGNSTNTQIWMTWSDWTSTANGGVFQAYSQDVVDLTTFMASNFPYGLMAVGNVYDEINLNIGIATSNVARMAYNATNLANAEESGMQYEYDENYIYIERAVPVNYTVSVDGGFAAYDHGMEYFTGTDQEVYAETMYGSNLKNKLERDVVTISQQTLTDAQKTQVRDNTGTSATIILLNADTVDVVYNKLNSLKDLSTATIYINGTIVTNLFNGVLSGGTTGTVAKISSSNYRFNVMVGGSKSVQINQTNMSASSWGTSEITQTGNVAYALAFNQFTNIPDNADLNSYTTPGSYICTTSTHAATMTNSPVTGSGFVLHVETIGGGTGGNIVQTVKAYDNSVMKEYTRTYTPTTWSSWHSIYDSKLEYNNTAVSNMNTTPFLQKTYVGKWTGANTTNAPISNNSGTFISYASSNNYQTQLALDNAGSAYIRGQVNGTWRNWSNLATYANITLTGASSYTLNVPNNSRNFVIITGATNARCWAGFVVCSDAGAVTYGEIYKASSSVFSNITTATNKITFSLSGTYTLYVWDYNNGLPMTI